MQWGIRQSYRCLGNPFCCGASISITNPSLVNYHGFITPLVKGVYMILLIGEFSIHQFAYILHKSHHYIFRHSSKLQGSLLKLALPHIAHRILTVHNKRSSMKKEFIYLLHMSTAVAEVEYRSVFESTQWGRVMHMSVGNLTIIGFYLTSCFHLFWKNILSAKYVDWGPPHLNLVVCCIFHLLIPLLCKT